MWLQPISKAGDPTSLALSLPPSVVKLTVIAKCHSVFVLPWLGDE